MYLRNYLIKENEEVSPDRLYMDDVVLKEPLFELVFERILKDFKPKSRIALFSLCTKTRPYCKSYKWNLLTKKFSNRADLIVSSSSGVVPIKYQYCYPFMQYGDAHKKRKDQAEIDKLYIKIMIRKVKKFLTKFKYDLVIFNFLSTQRNYIAAVELCEWYRDKMKKKAVIVPGLELEPLLVGKKTTFAAVNKVVHKVCIDRISKIIEEFENGTNNISGQI